MTSKTSSDPLARRGEHARFPPRAQLPPGVMIPRLPAVGTTWYERGFAYWVRRVAVTVLLAAILAAWTALIGAFVRASGPAGSPEFITVLTAEIIISLATGIWMFYRLWKHPSQAWRTGWRPAQGTAAGAGTAGILVRAGSAIATVVFVIGVLLTYGLFLALFLRSLVPVQPTEREARRVLADQLQHHHPHLRHDHRDHQP